MKKFATILGMTLTLAVIATGARAADYERFIGVYEGNVVTNLGGVAVTRDLSVDIEETGEGFKVNWTTTTIQLDGRQKSKSYSIDFVPSDRVHIYSSAMKKNLFGGREPLDPMKGDPYVWAHIDGDTLTVHALIVTEDGGYEMQTYDRTIVDGGLHLKFNRIRDGEPLREIQVMLARVD